MRARRIHRLTRQILSAGVRRGPVALVLMLVLVLPASWSRADQIRLGDGDILDGTILDETDSFFVLKTVGGVRVVQKADIASVVRDDPPAATYQKRRAAVALDDAAENFRLGVWCLEVGLPLEARDQFMRTIRVQPDHVEARRHLGYVGGPGRWYRPYLGEKPPPAPKTDPTSAPPIASPAGSPPDPAPTPVAGTGAGAARGEDEPIAGIAPKPGALPPPAGDGEWIQLIVKETVLGKPFDQSNLRPRVINALRWGAQPPFRIRPEGDDRPCRWRVEITVDSEYARSNTFMGLSLQKICAGRASILVIDTRTLARKVEIRGIQEEYTLADLDACAKYALWKVEDTLLERLRGDAFFRIK
ncbi:MAG: hypothetical protein JXP34_17355 [Planctomycetes bacterium]|nr:hypothetical protein [Planctomycetota bacterium]